MTDIDDDKTEPDTIESDNQGQDPAPLESTPGASPPAVESAPRMTVAERRAKLEQDKAESIERAKREAAAQFEQEERDLEIDECGEQLAVTYLARNSETVTISIEEWLRVSALALRPAPIPVVPPAPVVKPPAPGQGQGPDDEDLHNEDVAETRVSQRKAKAKPVEESATPTATVKPARLPPTNKPALAAAAAADTPSSTASYDAEVLAALKALGEGKFGATKIKVSRGSSTQRTDALNRLLDQGKVGYEGKARGTKWWIK